MLLARIAGKCAGQPWSSVVRRGGCWLVGRFRRAGGARALADSVQVWDSASYLSQIFAAQNF